MDFSLGWNVFDLPDKLREWCRSYSETSYRRASVYDISTDVQSLLSRVPQDSFLDPAIFIMHEHPITIIERQDDVKYQLYVDDTRIPIY